MNVNSQHIYTDALNHYFPDSIEESRKSSYPVTGAWKINETTEQLKADLSQIRQLCSSVVSYEAETSLHLICSNYTNNSSLSAISPYYYLVFPLVSQTRVIDSHVLNATLIKQNELDSPIKNITQRLDESLKKIYGLERSKQHREASKVILRYIEENFVESNLVAVNLLLRDIEFDELSKWSIAGLIRFTARAKSHLPAWPYAYRKAINALTEKDENAKKILVGIKE
ncbi:MAG: hypothetical protein WAW41_02070 [Methylobacter sp.]